MIVQFLTLNPKTTQTLIREPHQEAYLLGLFTKQFLMLC
jgi:hypothetical protein